MAGLYQFWPGLFKQFGSNFLRNFSHKVCRVLSGADPLLELGLPGRHCQATIGMANPREFAKISTQVPFESQASTPKAELLYI